MSRIQALCTLRLSMFALGAILLPMGLQKAAVAQGQDITDYEVEDVTDFYCDPNLGDYCEVDSVSSILADTTSADIDCFNATYINFDLQDYGYSAWVDGYLYQNELLYAQGETGDDGFGEAILEGPVPIPLGGNTYDLETDSYLDADYILSSGVTMFSDLPYIESVAPTYGFVGTVGTVVLGGLWMVDPFTGTVDASATPPTGGSGMTVSLLSANPYQVALGYTISQTATTGGWGFTLSDRFGITTTSATQTFTVGDPTPVVIAVTPSVWQAGTTFLLTITGTGFGTTPILTIAGPGVGFATNSVSDTSITATVTVAASSPGGGVSILVQSNGYLGTVFVPAYPGQLGIGSGAATVQPIPAPIPQILSETSVAVQGNCSLGNNIAGTQVTAFAGQEFLLTGCVPNLAAGLSITIQTWSVVNQVDLTGGYCAPGAYKTCGSAGTELSDPVMTNVNNIAFYWVNPNSSETVTYRYCLNNTLCMSSNASFNIGGPSGNMTANPSVVTISGPPYLAFGTFNSAGSVTVNGVGFFNNEIPPSGHAGTFQWLQVINTDQYQQLLSAGIQACIPITRQSDPEGNPELDNFYPYPMGSTGNTGDSPAIGLYQEGEKQRSFNATMSLMWDPTLNLDGSVCTAASTNSSYQQTPSTCTGSIPIPLASVTWKWSGCGVNTLNPQIGVSGWSIQAGCNIDSVGTIVSSSSFPEWTAISLNETDGGSQTWTCNSTTTEASEAWLKRLSTGRLRGSN